MIQLTHVRVTVPDGTLVKLLRGALLPEVFGRDRLPVLNDFTLWLGKGEAWAVLGGDEKGKTALLRLIAGQIPPEKGTVAVEGTAAAAIGIKDLLPGETGAGNVRLLCAKGKLDAKKTRVRVEAAGAFSGLGPQFEKPVSGYSEAERARLAVSMAVAARPDVLILSDALERCDLPFAQACVLEIRKRQREGMTLLLQSSPDLMRRLCDSALLISGGELKQLGPFETVYGTFSYPRTLSPAVPAERKELLERERAAFSAPLSPDGPDRPVPPPPAEASETPRWPMEARQAIREMETYADRLNEQLTAYATANLSFEQENERLEKERELSEKRLEDMREMLERLLRAQSETLNIMYAQFFYLRKWSEPAPKKKGWGRRKEPR